MLVSINSLTIPQGESNGNWEKVMNLLAKRNQATKSFVKVKWHVSTRKNLYCCNAPGSMRNRPVHLRKERDCFAVSFNNVTGR